MLIRSETMKWAGYHILVSVMDDRRLPGEMPSGISGGKVRFWKDPGVYCITGADDYWFDDIRPEDVVVDIGANAGAFCIRAAQMARTVFAVEPVTVDCLRENIRLNNADIRMLDGALGDGSMRPITWDTVTAMKQTYRFSEIRALAGGCDFLKCDCEGAEWSIAPGELDGVRRIEMELHMPPICGPMNPALLDYIGRNYTFTIERKPYYAAMGVFGILHAARAAPAFRK